ncbi:MAG: gene transfer agent family protein [Rhodobacteraceae bacterium]|nr:gene transfer agent family protein [Paracoccaceae bacterium]
MTNRWRGEVEIELDGTCHTGRLTLGALAELEEALGTGTLVELAERFDSGRFAVRDVMLLIVAGLRGGGWRGTAEDLRCVDIAGGPVGAARIAAELLARSFTVPGAQ